MPEIAKRLVAQARTELVARIAWLYLCFVGKSSRIYWLNGAELERYGKQFGNPLYAFWHGRQFFFPYVYRDTQATVIVSQSRDGEYIARAMHLFGMKTARGSSSRGGRGALIELKRALEAGKSAGITPDGPKGPQRSVAPGVLYLSGKTGKPVLPITYSAKYKFIFRGWDEFWFPLPFNEFVIHLGNPVFLSGKEDAEKKSRELAAELNRITNEADRIFEKRELHSLKLSDQILESDRPPGNCSPLTLSPHDSFREQLVYLCYNFVLVLFSPAIILGLLARYPRTFFKHFHTGLAARLGFWKKPDSPEFKKAIWMHAASLGECRAALPLARALREKYPEHLIAFSSTTVNGIAEAERRHFADLVFYSPVDIPWALRSFFRQIRPEIVLLLESEIWPNWIRAAKVFGSKIGVVNGRMSQKSANRYKTLQLICKVWTEKIDFVCARENADAQRFKMMGIPAERIRVTGNLKFDLLPWNLNGNAATAETEVGSPRLQTLAGKLVWTAASVRAGEERLVLDAFCAVRKKFPELKLVLAPRHLENTAASFRLLRALELRAIAKSRPAEYGKDWDVLVWDSFGDLWQAYPQSAIVFAGGSLVPTGGQNPIEAAWFGKLVLFGPHMENFSEPVRLLLQADGAIQVRDAAELAQQVEQLLSHPDRIAAIGSNAKKAVEKMFGSATQKTLEIIGKFVHA